MRLTREIRFSLIEMPAGTPVTNSWAGWPSSDSLGPYLTLRATVSGTVDPRTGYLCNIRQIDELLREQAIPRIRQRYQSSDRAPAAPIVAECLEACARACPPGMVLETLELAATPYLRFAAHRNEPSMVDMTQSFEFSASHRLYCPDLNDEDNRRVFGKCSNVNGHGHNYVVDVTVAATPDAKTGVVVELPRFERTVKEHVIERFDHRHLNADCDEFRQLNPTVENITRIIWEKLAGRFDPARLVRVRVWETPKTYAEYDGR